MTSLQVIKILGHHEQQSFSRLQKSGCHMHQHQLIPYILILNIQMDGWMNEWMHG